MTAPARRGDLVAIEFDRHDFRQGYGYKHRRTVEIHEVTGVTRSGVVSATRELEPGAQSTKLELRHGRGRRFIITAASVDRSALVSAAIERGPLQDVDEVREFVRPFLLEVPAR